MYFKNIKYRLAIVNNSWLFSEVKVNLKMASTAKGSFRKVNVDEYTEEKFKEEEDENKISENQINENEIQNLLQTLVLI